jgi:hypothetical protein
MLALVAQLNIYVPDIEAERLREEAAQAGLSLSRYVTTLLNPGEKKAAWPKGYFEKACGFLREEFEEPADPPPGPVEDFDR